MDIMLIECDGTHYEMGYQQGLILKDVIKNSIDEFLNFETIKKIKPFYIDSNFVLATAGVIAYNFLMTKMKDFDPEAYNRIKGISNGSGLDINIFLFVQFLESLISSPFMTVSGCTTAILDKTRTRSRSNLIIKNYDLFTILSSTTCVRKSNPTNRLTSMELIIAPLTGSHIGFNEAGLAISYNYGMVKSHFKKNLAPTMMCQYILENFSRTKQAIEFIQDMGTSNGAIFAIIDETGEAAFVEALGKKTGVRKLNNGLEATANMFLHPEMFHYNYKDTDRYDKNISPEPYHGMPINETSHTRYKRIKELLEKKSVHHHFSIHALKSILKDHDGEKTGNDNTICRHHEIISTLASIIVNVNKLEMKVAFGYPCKAKYITYRL